MIFTSTIHGSRLMLSTRPVSQRIAFSPCVTAKQPCQRRFYADNRWQRVRSSSLFTNRVPQGGHKSRNGKGRGSAAKRGRANNDAVSTSAGETPSLAEQLFPEESRRFQEKEQAGGNIASPRSTTREARPTEVQVHRGRQQIPSEATPSLVEQLFPEETKRYQEKQQATARSIPRMPIVQPTRLPPIQPYRGESFRKVGNGLVDDDPPEPAKSWQAERLKRQVKSSPDATAVLVLRNASLNLVEEDFRRLVPQGRHLEGWTLAQADFLKVVPGRNLRDLSRENWYYLLFSSPIAAFRYQSHVSAIAKLVSQHTPSSISSPILPPPGYRVDNIEVASAVNSFSLIPASQRLDLRLLKRPFHPFLDKMVRNEGYYSITSREGKSPAEVRFTMDGPQVPASALQYAIMQSGKQRSAHWSGAGNEMISCMRWEGGEEKALKQKEDEMKEEKRLAREGNDVVAMMDDGLDGEEKKMKRRTPNPVYVLGFATERAATSFVAHWNGRSMEGLSLMGLEGDIPPVARAELLW